MTGKKAPPTTSSSAAPVPFVYKARTDPEFFAYDAVQRSHGVRYTDASALQQALEILHLLEWRRDDAATATRQTTVESVILEGGTPEAAVVAAFLALPLFTGGLEEYRAAKQEAANVVQTIFRFRAHNMEWKNARYSYTPEPNIDLIEMVNRYYSEEVLLWYAKASVDVEQAIDRMGILEAVIVEPHSNDTRSSKT